ncbi:MULTISPECIES: YlaF family protein [Bacillus]|uniref:YlaF family protein n=2 Tax=Bacillus TaxID=1386 RepID=A0A0M4FI86_9BACI|nr:MULTISPECIES: YlaF family protein [Bacillus]ALC80929.1 hypothetical protein AM592_04505 [Bacillus gobiensis]MBP1079876.1 hypothetical protein [Bacillus capparidis]MED1095263.1 YlaF family protein [Bacillus capparidis]
MKQIKWKLLLLALAAVMSMMMCGVAVGLKSSLGIIGSLVLLFFVMGFGFTLKRKMRQRGELD